MNYVSDENAICKKETFRNREIFQEFHIFFLWHNIQEHHSHIYGYHDDGVDLSSCVVYELQFWGKLEREYANDDITVMLPRHLTLDDDSNDADDLDNDDDDDASVYVKSVPVRQNDQHRRMTEMTWLAAAQLSSHSKVPRHWPSLDKLILINSDPDKIKNISKILHIISLIIYDVFPWMNVTQTVSAPC